MHRDIKVRVVCVSVSPLSPRSLVKGANILTDGNGRVKLADFGAARCRDTDTIALLSASGSEFCNSIKG